RSAGRRRATAAPATPHPAAATGRCRDRRTRRRRQRIGLVAAARPRPHRHRPDRTQFCPGPGRPQRPACRAVGAAGERCRPRGRQRAGCGTNRLVAATHDAVRRRRRRRRRRPYGYAPGAADRSGQRHPGLRRLLAGRRRLASSADRHRTALALCPRARRCPRAAHPADPRRHRCDGHRRRSRKRRRANSATRRPLALAAGLAHAGRSTVVAGTTQAL
ncbi:hypothetical protein XPR_4250, partial [Xanthomonas arboricola pv. pruni MAFF 301420]